MATIDEVHELCIEIKEQIATINQRCINEKQRIDGHQKTLYGENGRGGLVAIVNKLNGTNTNLREWATKIISPIITALIIAAILAIWKFSGN